MIRNETSEVLDDNNVRPHPVDDEIDELIAESATDTATRRQWTALIRGRWFRRTLGGHAEALPSDAATKASDPDTVKATSPGQDTRQPDDPGDVNLQPRSSTLRRAVAFVALPMLAMAFTAGIGYLKYVNVVAAVSEQAAVQSTQTAKDSTVAMLSYTPDSVDKQLTAATDRMTGSFRQSYSNLIHDVVIPGAKEKKISAVATVPATASASATPDHAVVLVFVDQAITMGDGAPTQTNSVVQVTLDRIDNRWLISGFDPK